MDLNCEQARNLMTNAPHDNARSGEDIWDLHRERLRRMIRIHLDRRVLARIDASDIIQETFAEATSRLPQLKKPAEIIFYPWLRQLAWQHIIKAHRRHLGADKRSVLREACQPALPDDSRQELAVLLADPGTSPSDQVMMRELCQLVLQALEQLAPADHEILVLRYLEHLSFREIACVLKINIDAAKTRHARSLQRLAKLMDG